MGAVVSNNDIKGSKRGGDAYEKYTVQRISDFGLNLYVGLFRRHLHPRNEGLLFVSELEQEGTVRGDDAGLTSFLKGGSKRLTN